MAENKWVSLGGYFHPLSVFGKKAQKVQLILLFSAIYRGLYASDPCMKRSLRGHHWLLLEALGIPLPGSRPVDVGVAQWFPVIKSDLSLLDDIRG